MTGRPSILAQLVADLKPLGAEQSDIYRKGFALGEQYGRKVTVDGLRRLAAQRARHATANQDRARNI